MRRRLPSATVTFLFTDVEGSTRLLHELGAEAYARALAEHRRVLRKAFAAEGGAEVDTQVTRSSTCSPMRGRQPLLRRRRMWRSSPV
jgi:class 3 adenylate cyclase